MKLITVEAAFKGSDLATAKTAVNRQAGSVRAMPGAEHYEVTTGDGRLTIVQRWESLDAFDAYRTSDTFAELIGTLKPLMAGPPVTTVATVDIP